LSNRRTPDFGRLAADYDRVRPADASWREVFELVVDEADIRGLSVLDCGCGTGRLARALARGVATRVVGVDAEPAMLAAARPTLPDDVELYEGRAEALPFGDRAFERAVLWLVSHLLDRPAAFAELRRVLSDDGRLAIVTFDPAHFSDFWLTTYFPSIEHVDRARFPTPEQLECELGEAGFSETRFLRVSQRATLTRDEAVERIEARHISTFDLLDEDEVRTGTVRAIAELPPMIEYMVEWLLAFAQR
jgi:ubiquinone/menaquinone biosynthesis C-methylase UbiE